MVTFDWFCERLAELDGTSSRLALTKGLAEIFRNVHGDEINEAVHLLQGRVSPTFEPAQFGMADAMVVKSIAAAFDRTPREVRQAYEQRGDLGDVASDLRQRQPNAHAGRLSLTEVYQALLTVAQASGHGAQAEKTRLLETLLRQLGPVSDKYLVRILLGRLRLGVGDRTILDALTALAPGDAAKTGAIIAAYNRVSDLGLIGRALLQGGMEAVERLPVQIGHPLHMAGKRGSEPGYALRSPRLISFRPDKSPEETTTVRELLAMERQQGTKASERPFGKG